MWRRTSEWSFTTNARMNPGFRFLKNGIAFITLPCSAILMSPRRRAGSDISTLSKSIPLSIAHLASTYDIVRSAKVMGSWLNCRSRTRRHTRTPSTVRATTAHEATRVR